jgi:hypothetical protein
MLVARVLVRSLGLSALLGLTACIETADLGTLPDASDALQLLPSDARNDSDAPLPDVANPQTTDCNKNGDCKSGEYCKTPIGACGAAGNCTPKPTSCPPGGPTVCDCNHDQQMSACAAEEMGVNVLVEMPCSVGPQVEGGRSDGPGRIDP